METSGTKVQACILKHLFFNEEFLKQFHPGTVSPWCSSIKKQTIYLLDNHFTQFLAPKAVTFRKKINYSPMMNTHQEVVLITGE